MSPHDPARKSDGSGWLAASLSQEVTRAAPTLDPPRGSGDAFDAVYAEHFAFVWRTLRSLGVASEAIDDAAQDVFVIVHARLHTYDGRVPLRGWLFGIARNVARRHRARSARTSPVQLVGAPVPPDETLHWRETAAIVARFLDSLDQDQREVFVLAQLEGATAPEISEMLDVNLNTVYSRLRAARVRFARVIARHELRMRSEGDDGT